MMMKGDVVMITKIETLADISKLPTSLQHALRPRPNSTGTRRRSNINAAERKLAIQRQVVAAIRDDHISYDLGVQILTANNALGKTGKAALAEINKI
jgi:hypothetical protein